MNSFHFSHLLRVTDADIDALGHANNVVYLRWVQEVAGAHWLSAFAPGERELYLWVVREHRIRYHRPALPGEELRATTWIGEPSGASMPRFTRLERAADGVLLCEAETQWVLVDPESRRPVRVPAEVVARLAQPVV